MSNISLCLVALGMYLLHLLVGDRLAEFHAEVEVGEGKRERGEGVGGEGRKRGGEVPTTLRLVSVVDRRGRKAKQKCIHIICSDPLFSWHLAMSKHLVLLALCCFSTRKNAANENLSAPLA